MSTVVPPPVLSVPADQAAGETDDLRLKGARRVALQLDNLSPAQLLGGAPDALDMAQHLRRDPDLHHEPANVFNCPAADQ